MDTADEEVLVLHPDFFSSSEVIPHKKESSFSNK
jgi:hypothetical protein